MGKKWTKKSKAREAMRRRKARQRRENVRKREDAAIFGGALSVSEPLATIRVLPKVLKTGNSNIFMPFLFPNQPKQYIEGRAKAGGLIEHLKIALGVYALLAYHALCVLLSGGAAAKDALHSRIGDVDYWLNIGRRHFASRTAFVSEEEVQQSAHHRYASMAVNVPGAPARRARMIKTTTEGAGLLFRAYQRAQITLRAFNKALSMDSEQAATELAAAFTHATTHLSCAQALQVAILADIDPSELWLQHALIYGPTFEIARFVGRLDAGLEAVLQPEQFALTKQVLEVRSASTDLDVLRLALGNKIRAHFRNHLFEFAIHAGEQLGGAIRVTRGTRELWIDELAGNRRHHITPA